MAKQIVILGAGFGGLEAATRLRQGLDDSVEIVLIDKNDFFIIGFTKFDVMFGRRSVEDIKSYYQNIAIDGIRFVCDEIEQIDTDNSRVVTRGANFSYDFLIVALGADLAPEAIPGFNEGGYEFYSLQGAARLHPVIDSFDSGRILISIFSKPYKCPPAPYEAAFQLHDLFVRKGVRDKIEIDMLIPGPVPLPIAREPSAQIEKMLAAKHINLHRKHRVTKLEPDKKMAFVEGGPSFSYDLFLGVPVHVPPPVVRESGLGPKGWIPVDKTNLQTAVENVYAVGDVTTIPVGDFAVPKAGAFAEAGAAVVVNDILNKLKNENNPVRYEAEGTCYIETGDDQVAGLDANFLGFGEPRVNLLGPSAEMRSDKESFENDRIAKWFKP